MIRLGITLFASMLFSLPVQAGVYAQRVGESVYVRVPFDSVNDKVIRLRVGPQSVTWSNGVFDFVGERLIPSGTPQASSANAYGRGTVLRDTMDESPPVWISQGEIIGGNHKLGGISTVASYQYKVFLDYKQVSNSFDTLSGSSIILQESYQAHRGDGAPVFDVWNQYTFGNTPSVGFSYKIRARIDFPHILFGGAQFQRVVSDQTVLYVPRTPYSGGLNLNNVTHKVDVARDVRAETGDYNDPLTMATLSDGVMKTKFVSQYDRTIDVLHASPIVRVSMYGKIYPVAFEGPMAAGEIRQTAGTFGFLPF